MFSGFIIFIRKSYHMLKALFICIFGVMCWQQTRAQKSDTLTFYLKNTGELVSIKDSADYYRVIMPPDKKNKMRFPVKDFYVNGTLKMTGTSTKKILDVSFIGTCTNFYPNGKTKSIENFSQSTVDGSIVKNDATMNYPNGQLYFIKIYHDYKEELVTCHDSTGKLLADNGNGTWLKYDEDNKNLVGEGEIKDGVEDGDWHGSIGDSVKYTCTYKKGKITSGIGYDKQGKAYTFTELIAFPSHNGMPLYQYVARNVRYPAVDRENNVSGKVILSFYVEKDEKLSRMKILRAPDNSLGNAVLQAMDLTKGWTLGKDYGIPVSRQYIMPFTFSLSGD